MECKFSKRKQRSKGLVSEVAQRDQLCYLD